MSGFYCKILDHKLDIPLRKTNKGQQTFSFLGPKISHSTKNVKTRAFFTYVLKREILSILCGWTNSFEFETGFLNSFVYSFIFFFFNATLY